MRVIQMEFTLWLCMHTRGAWQQPAECTQIPKNTLDSSRGHVIATAVDLTAPVGQSWSGLLWDQRPHLLGVHSAD